MRAPRFPLRLGLRYRQAGDPEWHLGESDNISRSGVLFRAPAFVQIDAPVELRIALPVKPDSGAAEIWCHGRVVRTVAQPESYSTRGFAVAIERYDFLPTSLPFLAN
jgi:hypothetical protein